MFYGFLISFPIANIGGVSGNFVFLSNFYLSSKEILFMVAVHFYPRRLSKSAKKKDIKDYRRDQPKNKTR